MESKHPPMMKVAILDGSYLVHEMAPRAGLKSDYGF
jgi:hypothetical protein